MLAAMTTLLHDAQAQGRAVGAFNVYNLEGARAVAGAAEAAGSPAILQIHSSALRYGGQPLVARLCQFALAAQQGGEQHRQRAQPVDPSG